MKRSPFEGPEAVPRVSSLASTAFHLLSGIYRMPRHLASHFEGGLCSLLPWKPQTHCTHFHDRSDAALIYSGVDLQLMNPLPLPSSWFQFLSFLLQIFPLQLLTLLWGYDSCSIQARLRSFLIFQKYLLSSLWLLHVVSIRTLYTEILRQEREKFEVLMVEILLWQRLVELHG